MEAQINGGGQERGLRSGTLPTHLCVGFGMAAKICSEEMEVSATSARPHRSLPLHTGLPLVFAGLPTQLLPTL